MSGCVSTHGFGGRIRVEGHEHAAPPSLQHRDRRPKPADGWVDERDDLVDWRALDEQVVRSHERHGWEWDGSQRAPEAGSRNAKHPRRKADVASEADELADRESQPGPASLFNQALWRSSPVVREDVHQTRVPTVCAIGLENDPAVGEQLRAERPGAQVSDPALLRGQKGRSNRQHREPDGECHKPIPAPASVRTWSPGSVNELGACQWRVHGVSLVRDCRTRNASRSPDRSRRLCDSNLVSRRWLCALVAGAVDAAPPKRQPQLPKVAFLVSPERSGSVEPWSS